jgi:hypothetical protein
MVSDKQLEANRQNALQSTGPKTSNGVEAVKLNALRHGLRSVQTVVPGEDPEAWETHRAAVVDDLKPLGALEYALAETVAAKLWRLGRVVRFEAELITVAQTKDEVLSAHEKLVNHTSYFLDRMDRTDIPNYEDVKSARKKVKEAEEKLAKWEAALRVLESLDQFNDADVFSKDEWPIYDALKQVLGLSEKQTDGLFKTDDEDFAVHHVRKMLKFKGNAEEVRRGVVAYWRDEKIPELREKITKPKKILKDVTRRYEAALDRLRLSRGLPDEAALDKIQRYEAHLERGLHKALERLQALQEARTAIPSAINLAVVQGAYHESPMGSFGNSTIEAAGG